MNAQELSLKTRPELEAICKELKINVHHKAKDATLISKIMQQNTSRISNAMEHKAEAPQQAVHNNTPDQVRDAAKTFLAKDGYELTFPGDGTVIAKYKGAEESCNLAIPLRIIKMKLESVSRGKRALMSMGRDNTYPGKYTDTIISG